MDSNSDRKWIVATVIVLALLLVIALLIGTSFLLSANPGHAAITLPVLVTIGVVSLFASMAFVAIALSMLNLANRKQALALPEGSVRAVIALSLIMIFAVVAVSFYLNIAQGALQTNLNKDQFAAANDFAKQILTVLGTLLTAMTSFYFGSRVASSAHAAGKNGKNGTDGTSTANASDPNLATGTGGTSAQGDLDKDGTSTTKAQELEPTAV